MWDECWQIGLALLKPVNRLITFMEPNFAATFVLKCGSPQSLELKY